MHIGKLPAKRAKPFPLRMESYRQHGRLRHACRTQQPVIRACRPALAVAMVFSSRRIWAATPIDSKPDRLRKRSLSNYRRRDLQDLLTIDEITAHTYKGFCTVRV